jgi:hypothetical protein
MNGPVAHGRLGDPADAPASGERTVELARVGATGGTAGAVVEQILSGRLDGPVDYLEAVDELVVLLAGGAVLDVDGTPHRLVETLAGTSWLTVTATPTP